MGKSAEHFGFLTRQDVPERQDALPNLSRLFDHPCGGSSIACSSAEVTFRAPRLTTMAACALREILQLLLPPNASVSLPPENNWLTHMQHFDIDTPSPPFWLPLFMLPLALTLNGHPLLERVLNGGCPIRTHLVNDEQDAVLVADLAQSRDEAGRRCEEATLAHNGLDDNGGCVGRRALLLQDPLERIDGRVATAARLVRIVRLHIRLNLHAQHGHSIYAPFYLFLSRYCQVTGRGDADSSI